jgi:hypothetical protein
MNRVLRRSLHATAVVGAAFCAALLLGEGLARALGLPRPPWPPPVRIADTKGMEIRPGTLSLHCFPSNPRGYFQIDLRRPEVAEHYERIGMRNMDKALPGTPWAVEMKYNSAGYRGSEIPPRRPGIRRVVVLGDSFNLGWGLREEDMYTHVLEHLLNERPPGGWEVINTATANADFPRLWFLFKEVLAYEPDIVVYGMTLTDPIRSPRLEARTPGRPSPVSASGSRLLAIWSDHQESRRYDRELHQWYRDLFSDENYNGWLETKQYIRRMDELATQRGARFVLAMWPMLTGLEGAYPMEEAHRTVAAFCDKFEIAHHDFLDDLRGQRSRDLWVHPAERHPNEIAQRAVAAGLAPVLQGLAPPPRP